MSKKYFPYSRQWCKENTAQSRQCREAQDLRGCTDNRQCATWSFNNGHLVEAAKKNLKSPIPLIKYPFCHPVKEGVCRKKRGWWAKKRAAWLGKTRQAEDAQGGGSRGEGSAGGGAQACFQNEDCSKGYFCYVPNKPKADKNDGNCHQKDRRWKTCLWSQKGKQVQPTKWSFKNRTNFWKLQKNTCNPTENAPVTIHPSHAGYVIDGAENEQSLLRTHSIQEIRKLQDNLQKIHKDKQATYKASDGYEEENEAAEEAEKTWDKIKEDTKFDGKKRKTKLQKDLDGYYECFCGAIHKDYCADTSCMSVKGAEQHMRKLDEQLRAADDEKYKQDAEEAMNICSICGETKDEHFLCTVKIGRKKKTCNQRRNADVHKRRRGGHGYNRESAHPFRPRSPYCICDYEGIPHETAKQPYSENCKSSVGTDTDLARHCGQGCRALKNHHFRDRRGCEPTDEDAWRYDAKRDAYYVQGQEPCSDDKHCKQSLKCHKQKCMIKYDGFNGSIGKNPSDCRLEEEDSENDDWVDKEEKARHEMGFKKWVQSRGGIGEGGDYTDDDYTDDDSTDDDDFW